MSSVLWVPLLRYPTKLFLVALLLSWLWSKFVVWLRWVHSLCVVAVCDAGVIVAVAVVELWVIQLLRWTLSGTACTNYHSGLDLERVVRHVFKRKGWHIAFCKWRVKELVITQIAVVIVVRCSFVIILETGHLTSSTWWASLERVLSFDAFIEALRFILLNRLRFLHWIIIKLWESGCSAVAIPRLHHVLVEGWIILILLRLILQRQVIINGIVGENWVPPCHSEGTLQRESSPTHWTIILVRPLLHRPQVGIAT